MYMIMDSVISPCVSTWNHIMKCTESNVNEACTFYAVKLFAHQSWWSTSVAWPCDNDESITDVKNYANEAALHESHTLVKMISITLIWASARFKRWDPRSIYLSQCHWWRAHGGVLSVLRICQSVLYIYIYFNVSIRIEWTLAAPAIRSSAQIQLIVSVEKDYFKKIKILDN